MHDCVFSPRVTFLCTVRCASLWGYLRKWIWRLLNQTSGSVGGWRRIWERRVGGRRGHTCFDKHPSKSAYATQSFLQIPREPGPCPAPQTGNLSSWPPGFWPNSWRVVWEGKGGWLIHLGIQRHLSAMLKSSFTRWFLLVDCKSCIKTVKCADSRLYLLKWICQCWNSAPVSSDLKQLPCQQPQFVSVFKDMPAATCLRACTLSINLASWVYKETCAKNNES